MDLLRAFILGIVQAITEFLPISSSAHLIVLRGWLGFDSIDGLTFDVALHMGTLLALIVYFRADVRRLLAGFGKSFRRGGAATGLETRLPWYILAATVPAALAGALLGDTIERVFRNEPVIVATLVAGGILFLIIERVAKPRETIKDVTLVTSLIVGVAQSLALIPGVSRSGITIVAGMSRRLERAEAARFSFLLSMPIMLGAGIKKTLDLGELSLSGGQVALLVVGMLTSAAAGWVVIRFLLHFLRTHRLDLFAYYRFVLAAVVLLQLVR
ncbi:MAG: undecaprenyl-diphosphate phosphatase [Candidatus Krumholzibacteria bacterium]